MCFKLNKMGENKAFNTLLQHIYNKEIQEVNQRLISDGKEEINGLQKQWNGFCKNRNPSVDFEVMFGFLDYIKKCLLMSTLNHNISECMKKAKQAKQEYETLRHYNRTLNDIPSPVSRDDRNIQPMTFDEQGPESLNATQHSLNDNEDKETGTEQAKENNKTMTKHGTQNDTVQETNISCSDANKADGSRTSQLTVLQESNIDVAETNDEIDTQASPEITGSKESAEEANIDEPKTDDQASEETIRKEEVKLHDIVNTSAENLKKTSTAVDNDDGRFCYDPSILEELLTEESYKGIAWEFCELYNEDRASLLHTLKSKHRLGDAETSKWLYDLLKNIYEYTAERSKTQLDMIHEKIKLIVAGDSNVDSKLGKVEDETIDLLRQYQTLHGLLYLPKIKQEYKSPTDFKAIPEVEIFIQKGIELTWCICLHQPMTSLDFNTEFHSRVDLMATYRSDKLGRQGNRIEQVVWPPLRLTDDGTIVTKGIARLR